MSDDEFAARSARVLAVMRRSPFCARPAVIARALNFDAPCDWCPVGPPANGERCASVPRSSREAVARVLRRMVAGGLAEVRFPKTRLMGYAPKGAFAP